MSLSEFLKKQRRMKDLVNYLNDWAPIPDREENVILLSDNDIIFIVTDRDDEINAKLRSLELLLEYDNYRPFPPTKCVYRLDSANNAPGQQQHIHVYADQKHQHQLYAINIDGTPHDGSKCVLSKKHQQALTNIGFQVPSNGILEWVDLDFVKLICD